jgi:hypothetical protein
MLAADISRSVDEEKFHTRANLVRTGSITGIHSTFSDVSGSCHQQTIRQWLGRHHSSLRSHRMC